MTDDGATKSVGGAPPVVLATRLAHQGFVRLRIEEVRLPSGRVADREYVEHAGAVAVLAVTADDHVLLVRQWRQAAGRGLLEVPAGTREPNESVEETAKRELVEETGYAAGTVAAVCSFFDSPGYSNGRTTLVRADGCHPVDHRPDPDEGVSLVRVPVASVPALLDRSPPEIEDGKTLVALLTLLRDRR